MATKKKTNTAAEVKETKEEQVVNPAETADVSAEGADKTEDKSVETTTDVTQEATKDEEKASETTVAETATETPAEDTPADTPADTPTDTSHYILTALMNVRKAPDLSAKILGTLPAGTEVEVWNIVNDWLEVDYKGSKAFILYQGGKFAKKV